jgi:FdhD protein
MRGNTITVPIQRVEDDRETACQDLLAVEEPLEIRIDGTNLAVTMRTPGNDFELAAGFAFTENILESSGQIATITYASSDEHPGQRYNSVDIRVKNGIEVDLARTERHFYMTSSCGICGKASIEMLENACPRIPSGDLRVSANVLRCLPDELRRAQPVFDRTGGLHAAALFDAEGRLCSVSEDVGRHNALDKLIGAEFLAGRLPLSDRILLLSGRISFELVQKAVMAGIPVIAAVGAPSSLAVQTAQRFGVTLAGFVRSDRFNLYSAAGRLAENHQ